jgi:hypothetical protein
MMYRVNEAAAEIKQRKLADPFQIDLSEFIYEDIAYFYIAR